MSISIERYVSITSGVIGAQAVAQRELIGLRLSTDPRVPVGAHVVVSNAGDALDYFGQSSEYDFAAQYFAYVSPAPVSTPQRLRFASYVDTARPARVYGASTSATLSDFQSIVSGTLSVTIGGVTQTYSAINLSAVATLAAVATAIQTLIAADFPSSTVTYNAVGSTFTLVTATTGDADISVGSSALATLLGWSTGAVLSPGAAEQTPLEAIRAAEQVTDSFGSFSFDAALDSAEIVSLAQYNAGLNIKYMYLQSVSVSDAQATAAAVSGIASVGLVLNATDDQHKEAIPAAIMAATIYERTNATVNYMYRQVSGMTADVLSDSVADAYDAIRVNYYGETANAGQKIAFFQRGFLMGGATAAVDMGVHANEQWLKAYLTARLLSLQLSLGKIPANNAGRGYVIAQVIDAANLGKTNGTILPGAGFSIAQQIAVTQLTGDPNAWREVQTNGFWVDAAVIERTGESGVTEYEIQYTLAYRKGDVVRKIVGSHNLI